MSSRSQPGPEPAPSAPRLFHFSDDPTIERFVPRPVAVPSERPVGMEWLNGPLMWAVSEARQALYLFPRDCPRIVLWPTAHTTDADQERWWGTSDAPMLAHMEAAWLERLRTAALYRYELPAQGFTAVDDDWAWVSTTPVVPISREPCGNLEAALTEHGAELRVLPSLTPLRRVWSTTVHASGIRLRNAAGWAPA